MRFGLIFMSFLLVILATSAQAMNDDDFFENGLKAKSEKAKERSYPGARDEQTLEIQASLPQPPRATEGVTLTVPVNNDEDGPDQAKPATD